MTERPAYKVHPLWNAAMALTRDSYAAAERLKARQPDVAERLRKVSVTVPARIANALETGETDARREEHVLAARGALAELARQARRADGPEEAGLVRSAVELERAVHFELGVGLGARIS